MTSPAPTGTRSNWRRSISTCAACGCAPCAKATASCRRSSAATANASPRAARWSSTDRRRGWSSTAPPTCSTAASTRAASSRPAARRRANGAAANGKRPSIGTIARVAPFLSAEDRRELGVVDAEAPAALARLRWSDGALIARLSFIDRKSSATAAFSVHGAVAASDGRFVRFAPATARAFAHRFLEAGFVPRGGDAFALHDVERAATFVRDVVGEWDDVDVVLDDSLTAVAAGDPRSTSRSRRGRPSVDGERDWFELNVDVFVGDGTALIAQRAGRAAAVQRPLRRSARQTLRRRGFADAPHAAGGTQRSPAHRHGRAGRAARRDPRSVRRRRAARRSRAPARAAA